MEANVSSVFFKTFEGNINVIQNFITTLRNVCSLNNFPEESRFYHRPCDKAIRHHLIQNSCFDKNIPSVMLDWAHAGVNITVKGNGGPECAAFLSMTKRIVETVFVILLTVPLMKWGLKNLTPVPAITNVPVEPMGKRFLLVLMTLIFGIEIGFKFSSKTVIFLLNPCHVTTALQIYLLAAPPSKHVAAVFRFHLNCMNGAVLALGFPELDALNLPFETWIYWIQHTMMLIIPIYLLRLGGVFEVESWGDMSWAVVSYGVLLIYHFILLQALAIPAQVNLNHMLCPAVKDPFIGPYYRMYAIVHQAVLCPLLSKSIPVLVHWLAPVKHHLS